MKKINLTFEKRRSLTGRLFVLPFYIGFIFFFLRSAIQSLMFVFNDVSLKPGGFNMKWVGIENLKYIFATDPDFNKNLVSSLVALLPYAMMDRNKALLFLEDMVKNGKRLVAIYPGNGEVVPSGAELVGAIPDGTLYLI